MDTTITLPVTVSANDLKLFKDIAKKFGWKVGRAKKTGMEEALEDIEKGRIYGPYNSSEEVFKSMGINV